MPSREPGLLMSAFPPAPVSVREFFEDVVPALFADLELDERVERLDLKVGVSLEGEGGGDWTLHLVEGELGIEAGLAADRAITILQSVADWRAGLWEGRPGFVADLVAGLESGPLEITSSPAKLHAPANPEALRELERLPGRIDAIVEGDGVPDWRIGFWVGSGEVPPQASATLRIGSGEAEAIRRGELHPLEALITGQLRLEGDLGLIFQIQAIAIAASMPPPGK